jgi:hypothetical protein
MLVRVDARYCEHADRYFWLREPPDGGAVDALRGRVAAVYATLPPAAFMLLDPAVAGATGTDAVLQALPDLPEEIDGIPVRAALAQLASTLADAPPPPDDRRVLVERALGSVVVRKVEQAIAWVADALGFVFPEHTVVSIEVCAVAAGVPLGGLTGGRIDDSPICFAAVRGHEGSIFAEVLIHEATHVLDMLCHSDASLVAELRAEPGSSHQLWHAPYFVAAGEATRRFVDPAHEDFGETHGYYAKVPAEMELLDERGVLSRIRLAS